MDKKLGDENRLALTVESSTKLPQATNLCIHPRLIWLVYYWNIGIPVWGNVHEHVMHRDKVAGWVALRRV